MRLHIVAVFFTCLSKLRQGTALRNEWCSSLAPQLDPEVARVCSQHRLHELLQRNEAECLTGLAGVAGPAPATGGLPSGLTALEDGVLPLRCFAALVNSCTAHPSWLYSGVLVGSMYTGSAYSSEQQLSLVGPILLRFGVRFKGSAMF